MEQIEYKQCQITITPARQNADSWGASYRVTAERIGAPIAGMLEGDLPTPREAMLRAKRIIKVAINEALPLDNEAFSTSLYKLNDHFAL